MSSRRALSTQKRHHEGEQEGAPLEDEPSPNHPGGPRSFKGTRPQYFWELFQVHDPGLLGTFSPFWELSPYFWELFEVRMHFGALFLRNWKNVRTNGVVIVAMIVVVIIVIRDFRYFSLDSPPKKIK